VNQPLLELRDLTVTYPGRPRPVLDRVNLTVERAETLGLVGESGSGKSTLAAAITGMLKPAHGTIVYRGKQRVQMVFQDPHSSLNPSRTIGQSVAEPLRGKDNGRVAEILARVGMPPETAGLHPAALSGGQRQRVAIARALVSRPELVICDEPTSALDLSVQAQILNLLLELQEQLGVAYLLISHDADVIKHLSHRTAQLRDGRIAAGAAQL
jgi:ABC-type glutathione transport system ATPase component